MNGTNNTLLDVEILQPPLTRLEIACKRSKDEYTFKHEKISSMTSSKTKKLEHTRQFSSNLESKNSERNQNQVNAKARAALFEQMTV